MILDAEITNNLANWALGIPSIGVVIAYVVSIIRRRISADNKEVKENASYHDMLASYRIERDELKVERGKLVSRINVIEIERNDAISKVGKLTAEVEFLSTQVGELKVLVERLGISLETSRSELHTVTIENAKLSARVDYLTGVVTTPPSR